MRIRHDSSFDVAVIGGGIVGLAVARALRRSGLRMAVVEAESRPAMHQTGHNSGVIHSGIYYEPGSHKARGCVEGRNAMYDFCRDHGIAHGCCGKLIVATAASQLPVLDELERRGRANGLEGLRRLDPAGIRDYEPHVRAQRGLWVPQAGIVDFGQVAETLARLLREDGVRILTNARVGKIVRRPEGFVLLHAGGELETRNLINCAGLQSDRIARACGLDPGVRIVPFLGEYYRLVPHREPLVWNLVYPVPDPQLPFLGVHLTRTIHGGVLAGPNALPAASRKSYRRFGFSLRDASSVLSYSGFWRLAAKHWRRGLDEWHRSASRRTFVEALRELVPELNAADLRPAEPGIRAQAVAPDGSLVDDFLILEAERMVHVVNAPSPAATAALAIGRYVAERAATCLALE